METSSTLSIVHYLPVATTIISGVFALAVFRRYQARGGGTHLLWWAGGIFVYGAGTFAEAWITLFGWNAFIFKFWYIVGALLGGAPLAQGTVWLLLGAYRPHGRVVQHTGNRAGFPFRCDHGHPLISGRETARRRCREG